MSSICVDQLRETVFDFLQSTDCLQFISFEQELDVLHYEYDTENEYMTLIDKDILNARYFSLLDSQSSL